MSEIPVTLRFTAPSQSSVCKGTFSPALMASEDDKEQNVLSLSFKLDDENYIKSSFAMIQLMRFESLLS